MGLLSRIVPASLVCLAFLTTSIFISGSAQAQSLNYQTVVEGRVTNITETGKTSIADQLVPFQIVKIALQDTLSEDEQTIEVTNQALPGDTSLLQYVEYQPGDQVRVAVNQIDEATYEYTIEGKLKRPGLLSLVLVFVVVVLVVGRLWGALSLIGLASSFLVLFKLVIPLIISGTNPILAAILGSAIIVPATFYISHGFNIKTHVGVIATVIALTITGMLAVYFVDATFLTGFASEEAGFIQVERRGSIDIRGLLLAGIIIGTLGILDDITVGQSSTVQQLKKANPAMTIKELFVKGMKVGQDHISSMVNTLVLVYSGSALPLLLLFFDSDRGFLDILEFELIAEEIVRMLVGSIGLILAAPLATIMAAYWFSLGSRSTVKQ